MDDTAISQRRPWHNEVEWGPMNTYVRMRYNQPVVLIYKQSGVKIRPESSRGRRHLGVRRVPLSEFRSGAVRSLRPA